MNSNQDEVIWFVIKTNEQQKTSKIFSDWLEVNDKTKILQKALNNPTERRIALRLLLLLQDDKITKSVFDILVDLASVGHSDIDLCRAVIKSLPRKWTLANIEPIVNRILDLAENEEEYRRLAELYEELDDELLKRIVAKAYCSTKPDIREIADDFAR